jgi:hypothetical protein
MKKSIGLVFFAFVFLTVLLSGCASASTPVPPTFTPAPPTNTPLPTATSTKSPTFTPEPTPTHIGVLALNKDFSDLIAEPWCQKNSQPFGDFYCQDGEFHLVNKELIGSIATYWTDARFDNAIIQAQMRLIGESGSYGIVFGVVKEQNSPKKFYIFQVNPSGQFRLITFPKSEKSVLISWTDSTAIKKGQTLNELEVITREKQITLIANSEQIATITDDSFVGGQVGPVALEQGHVAVSVFKVWETP